MTDVKQTGAERLEQVRDALNRGTRAAWHPKRLDKAFAALDGCVLLTAEEAAVIRGHVERDGLADECDCLALLTPDQEIEIASKV